MKYIFSLFLFVSSCFAGDLVQNSYLRLDSDQNGHLIWLGGTSAKVVPHCVVFYPDLNWVETDIGFRPNSGHAYKDFMLFGGVIYDVKSGKPLWWLPQIYWFSTTKNNYIELWYVNYVSTKLEDRSDAHWALFLERHSIHKNLAIGPSVEWFYDYSYQKTTQMNTYLGFRFPYGKSGLFDISGGYDWENNQNIGRVTFFYTLQ